MKHRIVGVYPPDEKTDKDRREVPGIMVGDVDGVGGENCGGSDGVEGALRESIPESVATPHSLLRATDDGLKAIYNAMAKVEQQYVGAAAFFLVVYTTHSLNLARMSHAMRRPLLLLLPITRILAPHPTDLVRIGIAACNLTNDCCRLSLYLLKGIWQL